MTSNFNKKQTKIISVIRAIPSGYVASYGQIASIAGLARGHRLVARALRESTELNLPWYRVIRADGRCGMAEGTDSYNQQFSLLRAEGVIASNGRVDMKRYQWQPDMDIFLFRPQDL